MPLVVFDVQSYSTNEKGERDGPVIGVQGFNTSIIARVYSERIMVYDEEKLLTVLHLTDGNRVIIKQGIHDTFKIIQDAERGK